MLRVDTGVRCASVRRVHPPLAVAGTVPHIECVEAQPAFRGESCCLDMMLYLEGGPLAPCEYKIDAP